jgi:hypothetical protein
MTKLNNKTILALFAMGCITALEIVNLIVLKNDGLILSGVIGAIAGLGGFIIGKVGEK